MRKPIVIAIITISMFFSRAEFGAAAWSNRSPLGTWACVGSGYSSVKDEKGASSWVPASFVGWYTFDGKGKFSSLKETDNTAGTVCNYKLGEGSNSYEVSSDGTIKIDVTEAPAGLNPSQCPTSPPARVVAVFQNLTSIFGTQAEPDASGSFICGKRPALKLPY